MCGVLGCVGPSVENIQREDIEDALQVQGYRGPDNSSYKKQDRWLLAHNRLSVIDLSPLSNQPMSSNCGDYHIVFNGEIYNFQDIRKELIVEGIKFYTNSDTEVLLNLLIVKGIDSISELNGMFSFAFLNLKTQKLLLARDRQGIKPLFLFSDEGNIYFSSNSQSMMTLIQSRKKFSLDFNKLYDYLYFGSEIGLESMISGVRNVRPGSLIVCSLDTMELNELDYVPKNSTRNEPVEKKFEELNGLVGTTRKLVTESVKRQLIADVPIGVFLSGGVDSNVLASTAKNILGVNIKAYTALFDGNYTQDALAAVKSAKTMGLDHEVIDVPLEGAKKVIEKLASVHSTPLGDYADVPLYLLSKKISSESKVVLQGDGGDELFGGYSRHKTLRYIDRFPKIYSLIQHSSNIAAKTPRLNSRVARYLEILGSEKKDIFRKLMTTEHRLSRVHTLFSDDIRAQVVEGSWGKNYQAVTSEFLDQSYFEAMSHADSKILLPNLFLRKVDGATMAASIEARVPLLDNGLVAFAQSLHPKFKIRNGQGKWLLKKSFEDIVSKEILYGKKRGFTVPISNWLKGDIGDSLLEELGTKAANHIFNVKLIRKILKEHNDGGNKSSQLLWRIYVFLIWLRVNSRWISVC